VSLPHFWPAFPLDRIVYEDPSIIVIDKPIDVPTHGADPSRSDDALFRLKLALAERDRVPVERVYLGTHQRLDRDTSGALLFTRQKAANAAMGAQFEGRTVKKTYVAVAANWPRPLERGALTHDIAPGEDGRMRVVGRNAVGASSKRAVTRYRVLEREGTRALLELQPETGRTHQLRVQLAAAGGPIAGDRLYGGEPAPRLMLHAAALKFSHPIANKPIEVRAPVPAELEMWLAEPKVLVGPGDRRFDIRLRAAIDLRFSLGRSSDTTAFRLLHGEGDGIDGLAIDVYGEHFIVHFFSEESLRNRESILDEIFALGPRGIYIKVHPKQSNTLVDPRGSELAPPQPVRGEPADDPLWIEERGLSFRVALGDGLKTGIFLDQRDNRRRVRELSSDKRVLNLFAYTCGFTVAAAAGGARQTVSVDASEGVLAWGAENLERNGLASNAHAFVDADALTWLKIAAKRGERYDLVVLDPPSYATTKTSRFSAESDWPDLAARALSVVAPGGRMLACTNHRGITSARFRRFLHEAGRLAGRRFSQMKDLAPPEDFPSPWVDDSHLKSALITVE
jgi:23S rRNA (cytosine1962-C5)-methyltransferase